MTPILLFDIDMTLIRTRGVGRAAMNNAFAELFGIASITEGMRFDGRTDRGIFFEAMKKIGVVETEHDAVFGSVSARYLELLEHELKVTQSGVVLDGVTDLLGALAGQDAAVGLATGNLREGARLKMEWFGLWQHFCGGGFGDHVHERTSLVANAVREIAEVRGIPADPARAIVIGDTPLDVAGALTNGARVLGVATGAYSEEELLASGATWTATSLADTPRMLDILLNA